MKELIRDIDKQTIRVHGEPITINKVDIERALDWYALNAQKCIDEVLLGIDRVNDLDSYIKDRKQEIENYKTGNLKPWLGFWQKALYLKTGESVSIL